MIDTLRKLRSNIAGKRFQRKACVGYDVHWIGRVGCTNSGSKENVRIGNHGYIGGQFQALCGGKIVVGNNIYIGAGSIIQAKEQIEIGNNVIIANGVLLVDNNNHPTNPASRLEMSKCDNYMTDELWTWKDAKSKPIKIEDNVWIGKNATIMKGVTVGEGSIVALGAIVTRDVPPYTIVAGNPAVVVKQLPKPEVKIENK